VVNLIDYVCYFNGRTANAIFPIICFRRVVVFPNPYLGLITMDVPDATFKAPSLLPQDLVFIQDIIGPLPKELDATRAKPESPGGDSIVSSVENSGGDSSSGDESADVKMEPAASAGQEASATVERCVPTDLRLRARAF
jgi:hypothetical protein